MIIRKGFDPPIAALYGLNVDGKIGFCVAGVAPARRSRKSTFVWPIE
jgi:hypothetical protein